MDIMTSSQAFVFISFSVCFFDQYSVITRQQIYEKKTEQITQMWMSWSQCTAQSKPLRNENVDGIMNMCAHE